MLASAKNSALYLVFRIRVWLEYPNWSLQQQQKIMVDKEDKNNKKHLVHKFTFFHIEFTFI